MKPQLELSSLFDVPTGEYNLKGVVSNQPSKTMIPTVEQQIQMLRAVYDVPPETKERYIRLTKYLQVCCGQLCQAKYDPDVDSEPRVIWTDVDGSMDWFAELLKKMATATKEQVEDPDREENNLAFKMFMEYHDDTKPVIEIDSVSKVTQWSPNM